MLSTGNGTVALRRLPEPYYSEVRASMASLVGETEAGRELRSYKLLLDEAREDSRLRRALLAVAEKDNMVEFEQIAPLYSFRIAEHARLFKVVKSTDLTVPLRAAIRVVVARLQDDLAADRRVWIPSAPAAEFCPEDERFLRIARLTLASEKARQDAHHLNYRGRWPVLERLLPLCDFLRARGELTHLEGLFDHSPDWLLQQVIRYEMAV